MFAKNTLASAVAAAIGVSAVGVAQADTLFFPYVALSGTVTTIVSVINTTDDNWNQNGAYSNTNPHLHYRLYYKNIADGEGLLNNCEEYDEYLPTSLNDIQTIDLGGVFGASTAGVLFNDPSVHNRWEQSGRDYALGRSVQPARGYLTVDNSDGITGVDPDPGPTPDDGRTLAGEAFVFEFGVGAAWGYQAYDNNDANFFADFRFAASQSPWPVALMPLNEITTAFFVTPVSIDQTPDFRNDYRARIEFVTTVRGDLYDRDENLISGTVPQDVVCVGRIEATDLLSDGTAARLRDGGWGHLWNYRLFYNTTTQEWEPAAFLGDTNTGLNTLPRGTFNVRGSAASSDSANVIRAIDPRTGAASRLYSSDGAVVIKLEYNTGGAFNGESVGGTYNNAIMFRPDKNNPF